MASVKRQPRRTCIGCRGEFDKAEVVRIVAGPEGAVIDYREKLPGRAAYVCPRKDCIAKALNKDNLSRALHLKVRPPQEEAFISVLSACIREKITSLLLMSGKAGKLVSGYSAVNDGLEKGRVVLVLYAGDISDGTREKIMLAYAGRPLRQITILSKDEMGRIVGRELVGVMGIEDKGLADAVWRESERLKGLINSSE